MTFGAVAPTQSRTPGQIHFGCGQTRQPSTDPTFGCHDRRGPDLTLRVTPRTADTLNPANGVTDSESKE